MPVRLREKVFVFGEQERKELSKLLAFLFSHYQIEDVDLRAQTLQGLIALMIKI